MSSSLKQLREQVMQTGGREFHGDGREGKGPEAGAYVDLGGQWGQGRANGHGEQLTERYPQRGAVRTLGISDWAYLGNPE